MVWPDESEYVGQWAEDMRHGKGIMTDENGRKYEGDWLHGM